MPARLTSTQNLFLSASMQPTSWTRKQASMNLAGLVWPSQFCFFKVFMTKFFSAFHQPAAGFFILRWTVAGLILFHGISKLLHGVSPIQGMLASAGLPTFIAYGVLVGEVLAPLLVLANRMVVPAALVMAFNMVVAVALAHTSQLFTLGKTGGWALELQGLYFFGSLAIALMAPRRT